MSRTLDVKDLHVSFDTYAGEVKAVRGVSFYLDGGETLAIVGESGCGKSVTAQSVMRLNPEPPARIPYGSINLCGHDVIAATEKEMQAIRGRDVAMIFQDPMTCLNPTMQVGKQLVEAIRLHQNITAKMADEKAVELLNLVKIPNASQRARQYPHEYSGGMRQRAMIAMALICNPQLLIADEPTTALDVTIQAQIMDLLADVREKTSTAIILITHDLGVVAGLANRVAVMYGGRIVETAGVKDIFYRGAHPYTSALLNSLPSPNTEKDRSRGKLISIPGTPPDLLAPPPGCPFASRCRYAMKVCREKAPPYFQVGEGHESACWLLHKDCPEIVREEAK
jgi:oligopeptide transport system ATP-binding protein